MTKQFTPTSHSNVVGGSSASRVVACPASVNLSNTMPDQPENEFMVAGTAQHNAVEFCLYEGWASEDTPKLVGMEFYGVKMTEAHAGAVATALDMFDEVYDRLTKEAGQEPVYAVETQCHFPGIPDAFGTADILMVSPKRTVVLDWKFGAGVPVSAEENKQLKFYGRAAAHTARRFFWPDEIDDEYAEELLDWPVELIVAQPYISSEPSVWVTDYQDLLNFEKTLVGAVALIDAPEPPYARGEHCRWCQAAPICPMYEDTAQQLDALIKGGHDPSIEVEQIEREAGSDAALITPDLLAEWLVRADIVDTWSKSVRALAVQMAEAGRAPTGKKLVKKTGHLAYANKGDFDKIDKMLANKKLSVAERRKVANITPTQANALIKKKGGKPLTEKQAFRPETGTELVDLDDKRPAIQSLEERVDGVAEQLENLKP